jgi:NDP-sugar pyrophosphorylase family protein
LGVLTLGSRSAVIAYDEKPSLHYLASTGIYCFRADVLSHLERGVRCDLPGLVRRLVAGGHLVHGHRFEVCWLDVGRSEDYATAQRLFGNLRPGSLPESEAVPTGLGDAEVAAQ